MAEPAGVKHVEDLLADVSERSVADIVAQRRRLHEVLVEPERPRERTGDLRHLQGVRQPRNEVIADGRDKHLGLVLEAAKRVGVDDAIAVALELGAQVVRRLGGRADPASVR